MSILENEIYAEQHLTCSECPELHRNVVCQTRATGCPVRATPSTADDFAAAMGAGKCGRKDCGFYHVGLTGNCEGIKIRPETCGTFTPDLDIL